MLLLIALAQTVTAAPQGKIDLSITKPCPTPESTSDEVIVCGRRDQSSRFRLLPPTRYDRKRTKAELKIGNGIRVSAETEQVEIGGTPSNRAMIRLKFKF
ncbi:MAG: hypothetical protein LH466_01645 [Sphingomonas bacterium]|nr:hypothetical protein [Sphingomonas bacterium]